MSQHFKKLIEQAQTIVITTHLHPDADGIGSEIALCLALRKIGKQAICVNEQELMSRYKYLDGQAVITTYQEYVEQRSFAKIDLFIVVDTNILERVGKKTEMLAKQAGHLLFVDHHPCRPELSKKHCIDSDMAATGELVGRLIQALGVPFDREMGLALYTSILIDTSSFRYPTVSARTHQLIAELLSTGIEPAEAYNQMYGTKQLSYMRLLGTVLSSTQATPDSSIAWLVLSEHELEKFDIDPEDTLGIINHLLVLENIKVACMFRQIKNKVKISLRSTGDYDVGTIAQNLGGGGHNHSAAAVVEGSLDEITKTTIQKIQLMLKA